MFKESRYIFSCTCQTRRAAMQQTRARNRERTVLGLAATLAVGAALAAVVLSTRARNVVTQQKANAMTVAQYEAKIGRESRQQLFSYSGKKSQEDMNSYFDSLPHLRSASRAVGAHLGHSKEALKVSDDGLPVLPVKRMHEHVHAHEAGHGHKNRDAFATDPSRTPGQKELNLPGPANDGLPVLLKKSKSELENRVTQEHEINKAQLQSYKLENPSFKKNLDEVHKQVRQK